MVNLEESRTSKLCEEMYSTGFIGECEDNFNDTYVQTIRIGEHERTILFWQQRNLRLHVQAQMREQAGLDENGFIGECEDNFNDTYVQTVRIGKKTSKAKDQISEGYIAQMREQAGLDENGARNTSTQWYSDAHMIKLGILMVKIRFRLAYIFLSLCRFVGNVVTEICIVELIVWVSTKAAKQQFVVVVEERNYVYPDEYKYRTDYCEIKAYSGYNVLNAICDELSDAEKALFRETKIVDLNAEEMKKAEDRKNRIKAERKKKIVKVGTKERMKLNAVDRVKLALVYVVHRFIYGHQDITGIEAIIWHLVEDFVKFNNYPWGHVGYKQTFEKTHTAFVYQMNKYQNAAVKPTKLPSIHPQGMPGVLVVWAVQVFPKLLAMCGAEKASNGWLPYIFTVCCTNALTYEKVSNTLEPVQGNSEVRVIEDILWPEPVFDRLLIPGSVEGPLSDKDVVEDVSPIVQQPNASQGNVHMYDTIKEGNGTDEKASDAAFNPQPDADIWKVRFDQLFSVVVDINSQVTQLSGQVVHLNNTCTAFKEELSFLKSRTFRPTFMGNCNCDGMSDGASWNPNNIVKEVGGDVYENPIIDVGEEAVDNDEAETRRNHILGHDDAYAHDDDELLNTSLPYNTPTKKYEEADNDLKSPRGKKRNHDEVEASGCANENSLPKGGRIRKDSKYQQTPYTAIRYTRKPRGGVEKKVAFVEDEGVLNKKKGLKKAECSKIDLEISPLGRKIIPRSIS
ncbi:hypothetical protein MKW98_008300 [Papaver atlanticum]|uniref:DUF1985 domain-containing protein n=1 Tax=Papaver atlanticum TaxID=357466 RepID=A0AAD4SBC2_9MAGN|nr:hypothetical protein MKW98_008300 [Papaver atlanticum]